MSTLAERISARMAATGLGVAALARAAGTTRQAVYAWLNGSTKALKGETLVKAARALRTNPDWLGAGRGTESGTAPPLPVELSSEAVEVARAWMLLPDYKRRGYSQAILTDAVVVEVFPEIERAMRAVAVATDPAYHRVIDTFRKARAQLEHQLELDLKGNS